ncbi:MAG: PD-(D/E)XK nuclease family protein [Candidatus Methanosuratincola sp.]
MKEVDNFAIQCYRSCPRFFYWRIERGYTRVREVSISAQFGAAIHSALDAYYSSGMTQEAIDKALTRFAEEFGAFEEWEDSKRTVGKGLDILSRYFERYHGKEPFTVIATEIGGAFEVGDYIYRTRLDLVVEWESPRGIYVIDHKTTSSLNRMTAKPHNQLTGYIANLVEMYENVLGAILNCVGVYESEEVVDKTTKVISEKTGKPVYARTKREIFMRIPTTRTTQEIEEWKRETLHTLHQIERSREEGVWPRYAPEYCGAYRKKCQYLDLCNSTLNIAEKVLVESGLYERNEWKPYETEGKNGEGE